MWQLVKGVIRFLSHFVIKGEIVSPKISSLHCTIVKELSQLYNYDEVVRCKTN